jgi:hypothetical protein
VNISLALFVDGTLVPPASTAFEVVMSVAAQPADAERIDHATPLVQPGSSVLAPGLEVALEL